MKRDITKKITTHFGKLIRSPKLLLTLIIPPIAVIVIGLAVFAGSGLYPFGDKTRRQGNRSAWRSSVAGIFHSGCIPVVLCDDEFHVQHSNDCTDGTDLSIHRTGNGRRSESCADGMCDWRLLRICNADRYACKHDGCRSRKL